jgi:type I restriction enzyme M protein
LPPINHGEKSFFSEGESGWISVVEELRSIPIPLLPPDVQHRIVEEIEAERELVETNRKLIEILERKIQAKLAEIWGTEKDESNPT